MLAAMNRVILFVGDAERCADFYRDVSDLNPVESALPSDEWCELDAGGCRLAFHKAYGPDGPVDGPTGGPNNPHKIVFYAEDVPAMREELIHRGAQMEDASISGDLAICDGSDLEGHRFRISNRL